MSDLISRHAVMNRIENEYREWGDEYDVPQILGDIEDFPSAEQKQKLDEWCADCKEYDQEKHCCHRWNRVIRTTVEEMKQQKHGKWDIEISADGYQATYRCSECGHQFKWLYDPHFPPVFNYCQKCGARMDTE